MKRTKSTSVVVTLAVALGAALSTSAMADDQFVDVPSEHIFHADIQWLADEAVTRGCNPPENTRFCPDDLVTRGQMAAFLTRALDLDPASVSFTDTDGHLFEDDIAALASAGITRGCDPPDNTRFCPDAFVTRGQMAAFLTRALGLGIGSEFFSDALDSVFTLDIAALASAGITRGCDPPENTRFCPDGLVTRGQMAAFLHRALDGAVAVDGDIGEAAASYFVASEAVCIAHAEEFANAPPDPDRFEDVEVVDELDQRRVLIRDGLGEALIVDLSTSPPTIYSSEGPDAILPHDLSFGCPPDIYLGTLPA